MLRTAVCAGLLVAGASLGAPFAHAATSSTWTGAGDHLHWSDPANWSTHAVPVNGASLTIIHAGLTIDDLPAGTHLGALRLESSTLQGNALTLDDIAGSCEARFSLPLEVPGNVTWHPDLYTGFDNIQLHGHVLTLGPGGPCTMTPVRFEGSIGFGAISDDVGGGSISAPQGNLSLSGASTWPGTITSELITTVNNARWPQTNLVASFIALYAPAEVGSVTVTSGSGSGLSVYSRSSIVHGSLTLEPGATFNYGLVNPGIPHSSHTEPLTVFGPVHIAGAHFSLQVNDFMAGRVRSACLAGFEVLDNRSGRPVDGTFAALPDPGKETSLLAGLEMRANYAAGDGNDVTITCVDPLAVPVATTTPTTNAGPTLPATGGDTAMLAMVGFVLLALGGAAVRRARRQVA